MSKKRNRRIIAAVFLFYLIVGILAIIMLKDSTSVLAEHNMVDVLFGDASADKAPSRTEEDPGKIMDKWNENALPGPTESVTREPEEIVTEQIGPVQSVTEQKQPSETVTEQKLPEDKPAGGAQDGT